VSDFREGSLTLTPAGIQIDGKTILPTGQRVGIMFASALILAVMVAALLLETTFRVRRSMSIGWEALEEVVLMPAQHRACLVYRSPEKPGRMDNLAIRLDPMSYAHFVQVVRYFAPDRVREGVIGPPTSPWVYVVILVVLGLLFGAIALADYLSRSGR
jgi:hypothetical protein